MSIDLLSDKMKNLYDWLQKEELKNPGTAFLTQDVTHNYNLSLPSNERLTSTTIRKWLKDFADFGLMKRKIKKSTARFNKTKIYIFTFR